MIAYLMTSDGERAYEVPDGTNIFRIPAGIPIRYTIPSQFETVPYMRYIPYKVVKRVFEDKSFKYYLERM